MKRTGMSAHILTLLAVLATAFAVTPAARAEVIPSNVVVSPAGGGVFTFSYDLNVLGNSQILTGDYGVIYDVKGFVPGSVTAPAGWSVKWQNLGPTPNQTAPTDNPNLPNIVWTYVGAAPISPGSTTLSISGFSYESTFGLIGEADFASQTHTDPDKLHPHGRAVSNVTQVDVPAPGDGGPPPDAPEPGSLVLSCFGLVGLGLGALRKWTHRQRA
jgi:hypothetical protein